MNKENKIHNYTIPELAEMLDQAKSEKAKTIVPKFEIGQRVEWDGYGSDYSGEIIEIEVEIKDDGEPLITYSVEGVGQYWESELELSIMSKIVNEKEFALVKICTNCLPYKKVHTFTGDCFYRIPQGKTGNQVLEEASTKAKLYMQNFQLENRSK